MGQENLRQRSPEVRSVRKTGTVISFSVKAGFGLIKEDDGGELRFESSQVKWRRSIDPAKGQRLSYLPGADRLGGPCATDLQAV
jgi:cold shock CspA family protein